ncbi:MAG: ABC transporter ATP-binding protein [Trueperaceae bacterium]|nr:ABC transporter ATP-binding protein [Trueperaceae bacterium]
MTHKMTATATALRCENVQRRFAVANGEIEVLRGVTVGLEPGQVVAILGPSGSGKSTLLHLLGGLDRPTGGEIYWGEQPVHNLAQRDLVRLRATTLGLVFQQHYLLDELDVLDNVTLPGRITGSIDRARGEAILDKVGLSDRIDFLPAKLSGGERQRVAVARALYSRPKVILADEPTGSLDRHSAANVYALLVDLARQEGSAVLMVTHDEGLVRDVDARYRLIDGVLVDEANASVTAS